MADLFDIIYESPSNSTKQEEATKPVEIIKQTETINPVQTAEVIQDEVMVTQQEDVKQLETADVISQQETVEQVEFSPVPTSPAIPSSAPPNIPDYSSPPLGLIDGISLMEMEFPEPTIIVENLLYSGLSTIAGMPKVGKTWFCLSLSLAAATGTEIIGFETNKCDVLYLSFESKATQIQHRLKIMLQGEPMPNGVHFCTDIKNRQYLA